jgi:hypothetical protein
MPRSLPFVRAALSVVAIAAFALVPSPAHSQAIVCMAEPRDVEQLIGFYFSPEGTPLATPEMTSVASEAELPSGEEADADTVAAVQGVLEQIFFCFETEQYPRAFALMTEDLARQLGPDLSNPDEDSPEDLRALFERQLASTPPADTVLQTEIGQGRDVRVLEGGRIGGIWTVEGDAAFIVFEQEDGVWLLDEIIDIAEDDGGAMGTPAP